MQETLAWWREYIKTNLIGYNDRDKAQAPYKSLFVTYNGDIDNPTVKDFVLFCKTRGVSPDWHRLDGPAVIGDENNEGGQYQWWVDDKFLTKEEFDKHPLVVQYRLNKVIGEVLGESDT